MSEEHNEGFEEGGKAEEGLVRKRRSERADDKEEENEKDLRLVNSSTNLGHYKSLAPEPEHEPTPDAMSQSKGGRWVKMQPARMEREAGLTGKEVGEKALETVKALPARVGNFQ